MQQTGQKLGFLLINQCNSRILTLQEGFKTDQQAGADRLMDGV